ncbi:hypothetical protein OG215_37465 (plasmid) [Streptomyces globisporus]|uniref:hypothetical protein n=1 Tax=Streptomyces globisporus TaxID=1908 RepID=UPI002F907B91|nr:hypothetical protein OG215_37465 [Streptomyces globisporus]
MADVTRDNGSALNAVLRAFHVGVPQQEPTRATPPTMAPRNMPTLISRPAAVARNPEMASSGLWTTVLGGALLAAMLCVLASGTPQAAVVAPAVFLVSNRFGCALGAGGLPSFYVTALQVAAVIGLTMFLADARVLRLHQSPGACATAPGTA